jgi:preprotein translocase subunit SecF
MRKLLKITGVIVIFLLTVVATTIAQDGLPEVFKQGTIPEQLQYLKERTRIYENYRAIREDMYRSISQNTLDTLARAKNRIAALLAGTTALEGRIDSLQTSLETTVRELEDKTRTKNSIRVIGMEVNKTTYNSVMWILVGALIFLLVIGYLTFRVNRAITVRTKKDLDDLKAEFEQYRTQSRLEREKMAIEHFNEIKRLRGK